MTCSGTGADTTASRTMSKSGISYGLFDGVDWGQGLFGFGDFEVEQVKDQNNPQKTMASWDRASKSWKLFRPITKAEEDITESSSTDLTPTNFPLASAQTPITTWPLTSSSTLTAISPSVAADTFVTSGPQSPDAWRRRHLTSESSSSSEGGGKRGGGWARECVLECVFCKRNGEMKEFYTTHVLKDRRGLVICPVLRAFTCPKCGANGDFAHTESHCPLSASCSTQPNLMSVLRSRRSSCGKKVYYSNSSSKH